MTRNSITQHVPEFLKALALGENRMPERSRLIAALGRFLDDKDDFAVGHWSVHLAIV
ncbi:MAG: hypothetical protein WA434_06595 [Candidatus Acidiferrales bacterium]